jgi:predicted phosphate transport protein (TIGR00153 family)
MLKFFIPREAAFFDYFERHTALGVRTCGAFLELLRCAPERREEQAAHIKDLEHEADLVTHECMKALSATFITPMDRSDIHLLIKRLDDLVDAVEAASSRLALYRIGAVREEAIQLAEVLVRAARDIEAAVQGLRRMKNLPAVNERLIAIHNLESEGDVILREALRRLFDEETDPVLIIKWKELFERLEGATDRCEDVANIMEKIIIEAS